MPELRTRDLIDAPREDVQNNLGRKRQQSTNRDSRQSSLPENVRDWHYIVRQSER